jgi:predicted RNA-binding protein Jag
MSGYGQELDALSTLVQDVAREYHRNELDVIVDLQELTWLGIEELEKRGELEALRFQRRGM